MAWKKYFSVVSSDGTLSPVSGNTASQGSYNDFGKRNYSSYLPEVYTGHPNRVNRYGQYDSMDADSEIMVFAISEIVLPPMEIATFLKIALLHYSEIVLSPMERIKVLHI